MVYGRRVQRGGEVEALALGARDAEVLLERGAHRLDGPELDDRDGRLRGRAAAAARARAAARAGGG